MPSLEDVELKFKPHSEGTPYDQFRRQLAAEIAKRRPEPAAAAPTPAKPAPFLRTPSAAKKVRCPRCGAGVDKDCIDLQWPEANPPIRRGKPHDERRQRQIEPNHDRAPGGAHV